MSKRPKNQFVRIGYTYNEIRNNHEILLAMIRRNTAGRYKSTYVGFAWHLLLPVLMILVIYVVFNSIRTRPVEDFWIYLSSGIFPIMFISSCLRGRAVLSNAKYLTKMHFPREIVVIASVMTDFLGVVFAYVIVVTVVLLSGQYVNWFGMMMIPFCLIVMFFFGLGCSMIVSTATVFVKDIGYLMSVIMRMVFWLTPTFFMISEIKGVLKEIVMFNPFTYYVETFHQILYYGGLPELWMVAVCVILSVVFFLIGEAIFNKYQDKFPEVL